MSTQPEALRLADQIHAGNGQWMQDAATELRHLYEENQELLNSLQDIADYPELDALEMKRMARSTIAKAKGEDQ